MVQVVTYNDERSGLVRIHRKCRRNRSRGNGMKTLQMSGSGGGGCAGGLRSPDRSGTHRVHERVRAPDDFRRRCPGADRGGRERRDHGGRARRGSGCAPRGDRDRRDRPFPDAGARGDARARPAGRRSSARGGRGHPLPVRRERDHVDPGNARVGVPDPPRRRNRKRRGAGPELLRRRTVDQRRAPHLRRPMRRR